MQKYAKIEIQFPHTPHPSTCLSLFNPNHIHCWKMLFFAYFSFLITSAVSKLMLNL